MRIEGLNANRTPDPVFHLQCNLVLLRPELTHSALFDLSYSREDRC
jgi:hypothetical protein